MNTEGLTLPVQEPVLVFAVVMGIVLVAPLVFERLRIPGLVGLILAGVVVGPHTLGVLERDETIELLGTVGLLYLMFVAGLEIDLNQFAKYRKRSLVFSAFTYGLPQLFGTLAALYLLGLGWAAAVLLGSIIASHTLVAYPIVSRLGLAKNEAVTTAIGATIITDSLALFVLAVVAGAAEGALSAAFLGRLLLAIGVYVTAVFLVVPRLGQWFFRTTGTEDGVPGFVFVLATVFATAFLAELAGVESIVGAFLAGLALNRLVPEQGTLMNRVVFVGEALFIPFFLLSVGMLVDVAAFVADPAAWLTAAVIIVAVLAAKGLAAFATKGLFGASTAEAWTVFGLTVAQAAATLAAALIGYRLGLFGDAVLNATILMILVTCLVGPWAAERFGRRVALAEAAKPYEPSEAPQRILVPLTSEREVDILMELALLLRDPTSEQPLYPLTVVPASAVVEADVATHERLLDRADGHAAASDVRVSPMTRVGTDVADGIARAITEARITTVVLTWDGQSLARRATFGQVIDRLLAESRAMVLVSTLREPVNTMQRLVLTLPPFVDREPGVAHLLRTVKTLASQLGAALVVVCTDEAAPVLEPVLARTKPDVPATLHTIEAWGDLLRTLDGAVAPGDLLVVVNVREGTLTWRPAMRRLPRVIASRFAANDQIFLYPAGVAFDGFPARAPEPVAAPAASSTLRVSLNVAGTSWEEVLAPMLAPTFGGDPVETARTIRSLLDFSSGYAPEKRPGVILLHASVTALPAPILHVGIAADSLSLPRVSEVRVLLVLLSPEAPDSEAYLARLADTVALVNGDEAVEGLKVARSEEEVREAIAASAQGPPAPAPVPA